MNYYKVVYLNQNGKKLSTYFEFTDISKLDLFLQREKLDVLSIKKVPTLLATLDRFFAPLITPSAIIELMTHLHIIVKSGLPLAQNIQELALETSNKSFKKLLFDISQKIESGASLSQSLQNHPKVIPFSTLYLIRIGEETGSLLEALQKAKELLIQNYKFKRDFKMALIYPLMVVSMAMIAIIVWFTFVLPQMADMFAQMNIALPVLTKLLILISKWITILLPYAIIFTFFSIALLVLVNKKSKNIHFYLTKKLLHIPFIGPLVKDVNTAYITGFLYQATSAGSSVFKSLKIISENIPNVVYKESLMGSLRHLEQGHTLSASLQKEKLYNAFTIRMLNIGEKSGDLDTQLYTISDYYKQRVERRITQINNVIGPFMIIVTGVLFVVIMVGLMGPIFEIASTI